MITRLFAVLISTRFISPGTYSQLYVPEIGPCWSLWHFGLTVPACRNQPRLRILDVNHFPPHFTVLTINHPGCCIGKTIRN
ncbi:hypothetical protein BD289DRAFT_224186 [Coniella lustricola]|uniref:Secreted protein n=1 Tax=Coniella lustricola TaxID=2025994 RepID=A0A2T3AB30_9PEZI|nr:hypothetical protein BD289DRAFT_224186 [Coniella lustricola]